MFFNQCTGVFYDTYIPTVAEDLHEMNCSISREPFMTGLFKEQRPHEFRKIPDGFHDWFGIAFPYPFHSFGYGMKFRISSKETQVEYKFEGEPRDNAAWNKYDFDGNIPQRTHPHYTALKAFEIRKEFFFGFAWERKLTPLHGHWSCWKQMCTQGEKDAHPCRDEVCQAHGNMGGQADGRDRREPDGRWVDGRDPDEIQADNRRRRVRRNRQGGRSQDGRQIDNKRADGRRPDDILKDRARKDGRWENGKNADGRKKDRRREARRREDDSFDYVDLDDVRTEEDCSEDSEGRRGKDGRRDDGRECKRDDRRRDDNRRDDRKRDDHRTFDGDGQEELFRFKDKNGIQRENITRNFNYTNNSSININKNKTNENEIDLDMRFANTKGFCQCWYTWTSYHGYRSLWSSWNAANQFIPLRMKFWVSASAWKFRVEGAGQNMCEYEWQWFGMPTIQGVPHRYMHVRSPQRVEDEAICLSDQAPRWASKRELFVIQCKHAAKLQDAREIWYHNVQPGIKRFYNGGAVAMVTEAAERPFIRTDVGDETPEAIIVTRDEDVLEVRAAEKLKCIVGTTTPFEQVCGDQITVADISSKVSEEGNDACRPGWKKESRTFYWLPDDPLPWARYQTYHPFANIDRVVFEMAQRTLEMSVWCFNDHVGKWYAIDYKQNVLTLDIYLNTEQCTQFEIRVEKQDNPCVRDKDKKCQGIRRIEFYTHYFKSKLEECENVGDKHPVHQQWFFEPSNQSNVLSYFNDTFQQFSTDRTAFMQKMINFSTKFQEVEFLSKNEVQSFGSDSSEDNQVDYQPCIANCEALGKGLKIDSIIRKVQVQKSRFKLPMGGESSGEQLDDNKNMGAGGSSGGSAGGSNVGGSRGRSGGKLGDNKDMGAPSCSFIKSVQKESTSGFYWIKNEQTKIGAKVYCDMKSDPSYGVAIQNSLDYDSDNMVKKYNINEPAEFLKACTKFGLTFAKIDSLVKLKQFILFAVLKRMWIHSDFGVLVGIDPGCPSACTGKYYSLDGSTNLTDMAAQFNKAINLTFEPVIGNALLLFAKGSLSTLAMDQNAFVAGLLCQTVNEQPLVTATCADTIQDKVGQKATKFVCMESCGSGVVMGVGSQHPESNFCRAMVHSGQQTDYGGIKQANITKNEKLCKSFTAGDQNGVKSEGSDKQSKCYQFNKIMDKNPNEILDSIANKQSFIQKLALISKIDDNNEIDISNNNKSALDLKQSKIDKVDKLSDSFPGDPNQQIEGLVNNTKDINDIFNNNAVTDNQNINNSNILNNGNQLKSSAHSFLFNNNSNINSNINSSFRSTLGSLDNEQNNSESQKMYENPNDYLPDSQSKNNAKKMDVNEIYKSVSTFNKANSKASKKWPGNGLRKSDINYRHFREGKHEIMVYQYNNGFKIIKYDDQPNVTFQENSFPKAKNQQALNFITETNKEYQHYIKNELNFLNNVELQLKQPKIMQSILNEDQEKSLMNPINENKFKQMLENSDVGYVPSKPNEKIEKKKDSIFKNKKLHSQLKNRFKIVPYESVLHPDLKKEGDELEDQEWQPLQDLFHDQSVFYPTPPGQQWNKGLQNLRLGPTPDFRSDQDRMGPTRQFRPLGNTDIKKFPHYKFWTQHGDLGLLSTQDIVIDTSGPRKIGSSLVQDFKDSMQSMDKKLETNAGDVGRHTTTAKEVVAAQTTVSELSEAAMNIADQMVNKVKFTMKMVDAEVTKMFAQTSIGQKYNMKEDTEEAIPPQWQVVNPGDSTDSGADGEQSVFKQVTAEMIQLNSNPVAGNNKDIGVILHSKYHKTFDGSLHFNMIINAQKDQVPITGALFRYADQFNHYKLRFNHKTKEVALFRCTSTQFTLIMMETFDGLKVSTNLRVVIKFVMHKFKIWIHEDDGGHSPELDESKREKEFNYKDEKFDKLPFNGFDSYLKEGKIGFFCTQCNGLKISNIQLWADDCSINQLEGDQREVNQLEGDQLEGGYPNLVSPCSHRLKEDYKMNINSKFTTNQDEKLEVKNIIWKFQSSEGRNRSLINTKVASIDEIKPSTYLNYTNPQILHQTLWKYFVSVKISEIVKVGQYHILFLQEGPTNQFLITIHVNIESARFEVILSQVLPSGTEEIMKQKLPDSFDPDNWNHFMLGLVSSKFSMVLNKKDLVFDMLDLPQSDGLKGTVGVGINGMKAEFSDIEMDCINQGKFFKYIESLRKKDEISPESAKKTDEKTDSITSSDLESDSTSSTPIAKPNPNLAADGQLVLSQAPCVSMPKQDLRIQWINDNIYPANMQMKDNINPTNMDTVEFCPSCCGMLATPGENAECMTQCEGAVAPTPADGDGDGGVFDKCLAGDASLALVEQLTGCKLCVEDVRKRHPEVDRMVFVVKKAECDTRFSGCKDDPMTCTATQAQKSEAE